ncbi:MAG: sulfotransferase [Planctomycetota bacterium]|nr:sulfotransferase [Planctomycetota bacterium]
MNPLPDIDFECPSISPNAFADWQAESRLLDRLQIGFICGPQRSGTTWMVRLLQCHPEAVCRSEGHSMSGLGAGLIQAIREANKVYPEHSPFCRIEDRDVAMLCRQMIDRQLLNYIASDPKSQSALRAVLDKTPRHTGFIPQLASLYPTSKFILCTRDPRDAGISWWKLVVRTREPECSFEDGLLYYAEHVWGAGVRAARAAGTVVGESRFMETVYERRLEDPERETKRVLDFMGLDSSPLTLRRCLESGDLKNHDESWIARQKPERAGADDQHYTRGSAGNWRRFISDELGEEILRRAQAAGEATVAA